jgi:hypothetical protein
VLLTITLKLVDVNNACAGISGRRSISGTAMPPGSTRSIPAA